MAIFKESAQIACPRRHGKDVRISGYASDAKSRGLCPIVEEQSNLQFDFNVTIDVSALMPPEVRCWAIIPMGFPGIFPKPGLNLALLRNGHLHAWAKVHDSRRSESDVPLCT